MKKGAVFINVGRGKSVVEDDLIKVLKEGHLKGAFLDVFQTEPLPAESELWGLDNCLITPHFGGFHSQQVEFAMQVVLTNLERYKSG